MDLYNEIKIMFKDTKYNVVNFTLKIEYQSVICEISLFHKENTNEVNLKIKDIINYDDLKNKIFNIIK